AKFTGTFSLEGISGFTLNSTLTLEINNTGAPVPATPIPSSDNPIVTLNFAESNVLRISGNATIAIQDFISISGNFGVEKIGTELRVTANSVTVSLQIGSSENPIFSASASSGTLAAIFTATGTKALEFSASNISITAGGFASVTASSVNVELNDTGATVTHNPLTIGTVSAPIDVADGVTSFSVTGLNFVLGDFVEITGNFGFRRSGAALEIAASSVTAELTVPGFTVSASGGTLALLIHADGTKAMQIGATSLSISAGGAITATATGVTVKYSTAATHVNQTITIGAVSAPIDVAAGLISFSAQGVDLNFADFVRIEGKIGFRKTTTQMEIVGSDIDVSLEFGAAFSAKAENGALALIVHSDGTKALQFSADGISVTAAGFNLVSAEHVDVRFNDATTGHDYGANPVTLTVDGISAPLAVGPNTTSFSVQGFSFGFADFVDIRGDFGLRKTTSSLEIVASNVEIHFGVDGVFAADVSGGTLALVIDSTGKKALEARASSVSVTAAGLASITGSGITVRYNEQLVAIDRTLTIGTVSAPIDVDAATSSGTPAVVTPVVSFSASSFGFTLGDFVSISGAFGFRKTSTALEIVANNVAVNLSLGSVFNARTTGGTLALKLSSSGTPAVKTQVLDLSATGLSVTVGDGFGSVTASTVTVKYSNASTATNTTISVDSVSAPLVVGANEISFAVEDLSFNLANFVTISGDFGFRKTPARLEIAANNVSVALGVSGVFTASASGGSLALLIGPDGKKALDLRASGISITAGDFANATAGEVRVQLNESLTDYKNSPVNLSIGGVSATLASAANTTVFTVEDLSVNFADVVSIGGDFGFKKFGAAGAEVITVVAANAFAKLEIGSFEAGLENGALGLQINADGTKVLEAKGSLKIQGGGFASASADEVRFKFNTTGAAATGTTLTVGSLQYQFGLVPSGTVTTPAIGLIVKGLKVEIGGFLDVSGDFGFIKSSGTVTAVANNVTASITAGSFAVGVKSASLGLVLDATGKKALQATGTFFLNGGDFASVVGSGVSVKLNETTTARNDTISVDGLNFTFDDLKAGTATVPYLSVRVNSLEADFAGFVHLSGAFAFEKVNGDVRVAASDVDVSIGNEVFNVAIEDGALGLVLKANGTKVLEATGNVSLTAPGFTLGSSTNPTTVTVVLNETGVDYTDSPADDLDIDGVQYDFQYATASTTLKAFTVENLNLQIGDAIKLSGNLGFSKDGTTVKVVASAVNAYLEVGDFKAGVQNGSLGLQIIQQGAGTSAVSVKVLEVRGGLFLEAGDFASASATEAVLQLNETGQSFTGQTIRVAALSHTFNNMPASTTLKRVSITGLDVEVGGVFKVGGNFGFETEAVDHDNNSSTAPVNIIKAVASGVYARVEAGDSVKVGLSNGSLALLKNSSGLVLEASGSLDFAVEGFGSASAQQIKVKYNPTTQDFSGANSKTISINGINGTLTSAPNLTSVSITGLNVVVADVLNISGNFGFSKQLIDHDSNANTAPLAKVIAVASGVEAKITAGTFAVGVNQASLGLVMETVPNTATPDPNDTVSQMILDAQGGFFIEGGEFASVSATSVRVKFNKSPNTVTAGTQVSVDGISYSFGAMPAASLAAPFLSVSVTGFEADFGGFVHLKGSFGFSKTVTVTGNATNGTRTTEILVVASDVEAYVQTGNFKVGVVSSTSNVSKLALLMKSQAVTTNGVTTTQPTTRALQATGTLLFQVDGFGSISGTVTVQLNTSTTNYAANPINLTLDGITAPLASATNTEAVTITNFNATLLDVSLSAASISIVRTTNTANERILKIGASNITLSIAADDGQTLSVSVANAAVFVTPRGVAAQLTSSPFSYSHDQFRITNLTASIAINNTTAPIDETISTGSGSIVLDMPAGPYFRITVSGTVSIGATDDPFEMSGTFQFEQLTRPGATAGTTQKIIRIGASGVSISIGEQNLTNGQGALIIYQDGVAGTISGTVATGFGGFSAGGTVVFDFNTTPRAVDESVEVGSATIRINAPAGSRAFRALNASVQFGDYVRISGDFAALTRMVNVIPAGGPQTTESASIYAVRNASLFLGDGVNPDGTLSAEAIGLRVKNADLGVVKFADGSFALVAVGAAEFVGLDGLTVSGTINVRVNNSNRAVLNEQVTFPTGNPITVNFPGAAAIEVFEGALNLAAGSSFTVQGTARFTRRSNRVVHVDIMNASLRILIDGEEMFGIGGSVSFSMGGAEGFKLQDLRMSGFSIAGVSFGNLTTPATARPSADLISPVTDGFTGTNTTYIDVEFTDPNGFGLDESSILGLGDGAEFTLLQNGNTLAGVTVSANPSKVANKPNVYRYSITGALPAGEIEVRFAADSFRDLGNLTNAPRTNLEFSRRFNVVATVPSTPVPMAQLSNPVGSETIDIQVINGRRFIDVIFTGTPDSPINESTITGDELIFEGTGVADADLVTSGLLIGTLNGVSPVKLFGNTWRYSIPDKLATNTTGVFQAGQVKVRFRAGSFATQNGTLNIETSTSFTVAAAGTTGSALSGAGSANAATAIALGPLEVLGPTVGLAGMQFKGGKLNLAVAIGFDSINLKFGSGVAPQGATTTPAPNPGGVTVALTGILGTFDIAVDVLGLIGGGGGGVSVPGKFSLTINSLTATVPDVVVATANGISIKYDPANTTGTQELVRIQSASITFPKFDITGSISEFDHDGNASTPKLPGLQIRQDGLRFGRATLKYGPSPLNSLPPSTAQGAMPAPTTMTPSNGVTGTPAINLGSVLTIQNISISVSDFEVLFSGGINFDGDITVAFGNSDFLPNQPFNIKLRDTVNDADDIAISSSFDFEDGRVIGFQLAVDSLEMQFGQWVKIGATTLTIDTRAINDTSRYLVAFGTPPSGSLGPVVTGEVSATVTAGSLSLKGSARNFGFKGDGSFHTFPGFGVFLSVGSATGASVGWPTWLPIKITEIGIEWPDIQNDPADFLLTLSAEVTKLPGLPLEFSGAIEGIKIDIGKLLNGEFPIVDIRAIGVSVKGNLFGGTINGGLIGGILKLYKPIGSATFQMVPTNAPPNHQVDARVLFIGIEGGFDFAGLGGFGIKFALSELGPLEVEVRGSIPGGIILEPNSGLAINDFVGGVQFFKSLPSIDDPKDLRRPEFNLSPPGTPAGDWLAQVKQQVVNQYNAVQANPNLGGFLAAFTQPMTITGSAKIFTAYASEQVFNGQVVLKFATDGKILIVGKLNFAADNLSISARLFADLSKIAEGSAKILFLADVPDQVRLLTMYGKFSMGFKNPAGQPVEFDTVPATAFDVTRPNPTADLADPGDAGRFDVGLFNSRLHDGKRYLDVVFTPSQKTASDPVPSGQTARVGESQNLLLSSILDAEDEFTLTHNGTTLNVQNTPIPLKTVVNAQTGMTEYAAITVDATIAGDTIEAAIARAGGTNRFRYLIEDSTALDVGTVTVNFTANAFEDTDGAASPDTVVHKNLQETESFVLTGVVADLASPGAGGVIDYVELNGRLYLDVAYRGSVNTAGGYHTVTASSITDTDAEFSVSGAGLTLVPSQVPTLVPGTTSTYRYQLSGTPIPGTVTVTFVAGQVTDGQSKSNGAETQTFRVTGPTAEIVGYSGGVIGLSKVNAQNYLDVRFHTSAGRTLNGGTIDGGEFTLSGSAVAGLTVVIGTPVLMDSETNTYRYSLSTDLKPGRLEVEFAGGAWADDQNAANLAETQEFAVQAATATLADPLAGRSIDKTKLNGAQRRYIDVTFTPTTGSEVDASTILDSAPEFSLTVPSGSTSITLDPNPVRQGTSNTFRYFYTGEINAGEVTVTFTDGAWADTSGTTGEAGTAKFKVINQAPAFELSLSGGLELNAAGLTSEPLIDIRGQVTLNIQQSVDAATGAIGARFTVDLSGTIKLIYLGNIGSAAGRFVFDTGGLFMPNGDINPNFNPKLWGVLKLQANLAKLEDFGIHFDADLLLTLNTTTEDRTETISLEGIKGDLLFSISNASSIISELPASQGGLTGSALPTALNSAFTAQGVTLANGSTIEKLSEGNWRIEEPNVGQTKGRQFFVVQEGSSLKIHGESQTFQLDKLTFAIQATGELVFRVMDGVASNNNDTDLTTDPAFFKAVGGFYTRIGVRTNTDGTFNSAYFEMFVLAEMKVGIPTQSLDNPLFNFDAKGFLSVDTLTGVAASIELSLTRSDGGLTGSSLTGSFTLLFNTTSADINFAIPQAFHDLLDPGDSTTVFIPGGAPILGSPGNYESPGFYFVISGNGNLTLLNVVTLAGEFRLKISSAGIAVNASITTSIAYIGNLSGSVALTIDQDGLYGRVELGLGVNAFAGISLNANFLLEFNTANLSKDITTKTIDPVTGALSSSYQTVTLDPVTLRLMVGGSFTIGGFAVRGKLEIALSATEFSATLTARVTLGPLGDISASGGLIINSQGIIGRVNLSFAAGVTLGQNVGLSFSGAANFEFRINTTSATRQVNGVDVAPGVLVRLNANVTFTGFADASLLLEIKYSSGSLTIYINGTINVGGGLSVTATGFLGVYSDGVALSATVTVNASIAGGLIRIEATGTLQFNTRTSEVNYANVNIPGRSFKLILYGKVVLLELFSFTSNFDIVVGSTVTLPRIVGQNNFTAVAQQTVSLGVGEWAFTFSAQIDFFGIAKLGASGWIRSNGHFGISFSGDLVIGSSDWGIHGNFGIYAYYLGGTNFGFGGGASAKLVFGGWDLAGVSVSFDYNGSTGLITIEGCLHLDFWLFSVDICARFTIGLFKLPPPVYLASKDAGGGQTTRIDGGSVGSSGNLYLNMGSLGSRRDLANDDTNEHFYIKHVSGSVATGGETVEVSAFGRTQQFSGVRKIIADGGSGNDMIIIRNGVDAAVNLQGGDGDDVIIHEGPGGGTGNEIRGNAGNDFLQLADAVVASVLIYGGANNDTIRGGNNADTIYGDDGDDRIEGRGGNDLIYGGSGADTIIGGLGLDQLSGGSEPDTFLWSKGDDADISINGETGSDKLVITAGSNSENITVYQESNTNLKVRWNNETLT
ncbi:MAG: calcium-binding protein, partial [Verrucomicrobiota bacterium]